MVCYASVHKVLVLLPGDSIPHSSGERQLHRAGSKIHGTLHQTGGHTILFPPLSFHVEHFIHSDIFHENEILLYPVQTYSFDDGLLSLKNVLKFDI